MIDRKVSTLRALLVSLTAAIGSSAIFGGLVVLVTKASQESPDDTSLLVQVFGSALMGVLAGLPLSIPLGLVGGSCAAYLLRREGVETTRTRWIVLGGGAGVVIGALLGL